MTILMTSGGKTLYALDSVAFSQNHPSLRKHLQQL